mmetsp:Transcript_31509/g.67174  ORF Transcript_31509/g.67174 Transcript_31509/m.67174 type:complete len:82 (-) Transcript_31509:31-276(-)
MVRTIPTQWRGESTTSTCSIIKGIINNALLRPTHVLRHIFDNLTLRDGCVNSKECSVTQGSPPGFVLTKKMIEVSARKTKE